MRCSSACDRAPSGLKLAPRLLHLLVLHAQRGADLVAFGRHCGATQDARPSAAADPAGHGAHLAVGGHHRDVAAGADDEVEPPPLSQHPIEFLIAEATVGDDANLDVGGQGIGETDQRLVFVFVAMALEAAVATVSHSNGVARP